jgi:hypothetical protein
MATVKSMSISKGGTLPSAAYIVDGNFNAYSWGADRNGSLCYSDTVSILGSSLLGYPTPRLISKPASVSFTKVAAGGDFVLFLTNYGSRAL